MPETQDQRNKMLNATLPEIDLWENVAALNSETKGVLLIGQATHRESQIRRGVARPGEYSTEMHLEN